MTRSEQECVDLVKALSVQRARKIVDSIKNTSGEKDLAFKTQLITGLRFSGALTLDDRTQIIRQRRDIRRARQIQLSRDKSCLVAA